MDISLFFGRLHPLIVHLPIGFLLMAILLEWFDRKSVTPGRGKAIDFVLLCGAGSAVLAAVFGWLLGNAGGYEDFLLFWHRWLGIATGALAITAWWSRRNARQKAYTFSLWGMGLLLLITGHLGGSLTHGSDYLIQPLSGDVRAAGSTLQLPTQPDSVVVFTHLVEPVLDAKCYSCHNDEKQKGGLNLATWEGIEKGGENGKVIEDDAWESELFKRVILPQHSKKFMPLKGEPLTYSEVNILKWWIDEGARPDAGLLEHTMPDEIKNILIRKYGYDPKPRPFAETAVIEPLPAGVLSALNDHGWQASPLGVNNHFIEVTPAGSDSLSTAMLDSLMKAQNHITWLDLGNTGLTDQHLQIIARFPNLSRLRVENNHITDDGLASLEGLEHLESLNLYNNPVTDAGLKTLEKMSALKRVYLWKTGVTSEGVAALREKRPDLDVDAGIQMAGDMSLIE